MRSGRHFLQIPGPTPVPDRILRAMDRPAIDHRGPISAARAAVLSGSRRFSRPRGRCSFSLVRHRGLGGCPRQYAVAGRHGADVRDGTFRHPVEEHGAKLGLKPSSSDWRGGVDPARSRSACAGYTAHVIKAVCVVHNETSTGATAVSASRAAIDRGPSRAAAGRYDFVAGVRRLLPRRMGGRRHRRGLAKGPDAAARPRLHRGDREGAEGAPSQAKLPSFFSWEDMQGPNASGFFPYTPATNLLYGLAEAIDMLHEEGLDACSPATSGWRGDASRRGLGAWKSSAAIQRTIRRC